MLKALALRRGAARSVAAAATGGVRVGARRIGSALRAHRLRGAVAAPRANFASNAAAARCGDDTRSGSSSGGNNRNGGGRQRTRARGAAFGAVLPLGTAGAAAAAAATVQRLCNDEQLHESVENVLDVFDAFEEGVRYQTGADDRPRDMAKALKLFTEAAEKGYAPAQFNLASLYLAGNGVARDDAAAVKWLRRAAAQEDSEAMFLLGLLYSIGRGVEGGQSAQSAMELWQRAADQNYAPAQLRLAAAYKPRDASDTTPNAAAAGLAASGYRSFQLPDDMRSAGKCLYWLVRAARAGLPEAHAALQQHAQALSAAAGWTVGTFDQAVHTPLLFGDAQGAVAGGAAAAVPTNAGAAAAAGAGVGKSSTFAAVTAPAVETVAFADSTATELHRLYQLGLSYRLAQGAAQERAVAALRTAAERGYAVAQCELAAAYALGVGVARDEAQSEQWFVAAAAQGLPTAMFNLGARSMAGDDMPRALEWFVRAAVRGEPQAQNNLGTMFCRGLAVEADAEAGVRWFAYAARRGMPEAMYALGQAYENGVGVDRDLAAAAAWYSEAAGRGVAQAKTALQVLKSTGTTGSKVVVERAAVSATAEQPKAT